MRWFREARRPRPGRKSEARKQFFFEKKKQKTFALCRAGRFTLLHALPPETDKSFLVLFFKKERLSSRFPAFKDSP